MKKLVVAAACAAALVASLVPQASAAAKQQKVEGSIAMMAPFFGDLNSCYAGGHRRIAVLSQGHVNGVVGYHFDIDPATWNKNFKLEVTGGQGDVDLDMTFYTEFGTVEQATDTGYAPANISFEEREPGGESGKVPAEMNKAIVCMWNGMDAEFTYTAGKGVK